jgi:serine/threonine protein kinase
VLTHRALGLAADVAAGLAELHGLGVVHLDVKPGNVLIDEHGRAVGAGTCGDATSCCLL